MSRDILSEYEPLFKPRSVALLGASGTEGKVGRMWMERFVEAGFENLYPVNLRENEIMGIKAYPSLTDIPDPIDYVLVLLPPKAVPDAIKECIAKEVKGITISSASLGFFGEDAKTQEKELVRMANEKGVRLIGPNCNGIYCPASRLPFPLGPSMESGSIGIVSQSGSFADIVTNIATGNRVTFSKAISCGNESDLTAVDFLEYLGADQDTKIILAYLEGVNDGRRFNRLAREISKKKPLIVWKCGTTEMGAKAAATHTGALAGSQEVWNGVLTGAGVINIESLEEGLDLLYTFNSQPFPSGKRIAIIAGTGGPAVGTVDMCLELGLDVPHLSAHTKDNIQQIIPPFGSSAENPVDLSIASVVNPKMFGEALKILEEDDRVDMMLVIGAGGGNEFPKAMIDVKNEIRKPFAVSSINPLDEVAQEYKMLLSHGVPIFSDPGRAAKALSKLAEYAEFRSM